MALAERVSSLDSMFLRKHVRVGGTAFTVDSLIDCLLLLYDECVRSSLSKEKTLQGFVKFGKLSSSRIIQLSSPLKETSRSAAVSKYRFPCWQETVTECSNCCPFWYRSSISFPQSLEDLCQSSLAIGVTNAMLRQNSDGVNRLSNAPYRLSLVRIGSDSVLL